MTEDYTTPDDDMDDENADETEETDSPPDLSSLVVYSRDWTIETIYNQIEKGNIDLNPKFQRRNAWKDDKRSKLIESLIIGMPVPEVVLAEHPENKRSFIVVDGKQRLLTIAGFINPKGIGYWNYPKLSKLKVRKDLNGLTYDEIRDTYPDEYRRFLNADMRCTVISNYKSTDVLYDIFYRLNSGSVPLSSQELRQALNKGQFADYLMEITSELQPVHKVMKIDGPDVRLRDVEIIHRFICFVLFSKAYRGNLRRFLDDQMGEITKNWEEYSDSVKQTYADFNMAIEKLESVFGAEKIGRRYTEGKGWVSKLNRALFEVEAYYFMHLDEKVIVGKDKRFVEAFQAFCTENTDFIDSIRITTGNLKQYATRYKLFCEFVNKTLGTDLSMLPFDYGLPTV